MPTLDWIFLAVLLISLVVGAWRGLVYELFSVANWIVAFVLAQWFAPEAARWLPMSSASEVVRYAVGFVLVFVLSLFAGGLVAFLMSKLVQAVGLRPVDRVLRWSAPPAERRAVPCRSGRMPVPASPLQARPGAQSSAHAPRRGPDRQ